MYKVYIWGAGEFSKEVFDTIDKDKCEFLGFVDKSKHGTLWENKYEIFSLEILNKNVYDYIVVAIKNVRSILTDAKELCVSREKLLFFFENEFRVPIFDEKYLQIYRLQTENISLKRKLDNAPYELGVRNTPHLIDAEKLLMSIIENGYSLARFGDGEFEMMRQISRPWFQNPNEKLANRLLEVIHSDKNQIFIAIADNFGNLDKYTEEAADDIREYLSVDTRNAIMDILEQDKIYGDAYVTRPYIIYKDKTYATKIFALFKKLWKNRNVIIVEGKYCRIGIGNDLLQDAKSIRRIICPARNAFDKYDEIKNAVIRQMKKDDLILISLGPTATVLAYDIGLEGVQAIDIGQIDTEYEWYLMHVDIRSEVSGKIVAELSWCHQPEVIYNEEYEQQIVEIIEG